MTDKYDRLRENLYMFGGRWDFNDAFYEDIEGLIKENEYLNDKVERYEFFLNKIRCEHVVLAPYGNEAIIRSMKSMADKALNKEE